ncbi:MAG: hypothetical protein PHV82_12565 [Victivallaceae bacterium]|nr:hypothetical protein [Victivallaceae bacterium]
MKQNRFFQYRQHCYPQPFGPDIQWRMPVGKPAGLQENGKEVKVLTWELYWAAGDNISKIKNLLFFWSIEKVNARLSS